MENGLQTVPGFVMIAEARDKDVARIKQRLFCTWIEDPFSRKLSNFTPPYHTGRINVGII